VINGEGGIGSLVAFEPVMLPGETNLREATGDVVAAEAEALTISKTEALSWLQTKSSLADQPGYVADLSDLRNRTITVTEGPARDQFRLIVGVTVTGASGENVRLQLNEPWDLPADQLSTITKYALTEESLNFFVKEEEQVDFLLLQHDDSQADNVGRVTESRISGLGMGPDLMLGGQLQPGGISYENLEVMTLQLGSGLDKLEVLGTPARRDNFRTWTIIHTGAGNDEVVAALNAEDATVATGTVTSQTDTTLVDAAANFPTAGRHGRRPDAADSLQYGHRAHCCRVGNAARLNQHLCRDQRS
jgi:hypothetical protein